MAESEEKVCTFIKKRRQPAQIRSKADSDAEDNDEKPKKSTADDSDQEEAPKRSRKPSEDDDSNSDTDLTENLNELKRKYDKTKSSILTQSSKQTKNAKEEFVTKFAANKEPNRTGPDDMGATAVYNLDTEFDRDARAIFERAKKLNDEQKSASGDDKVYRGINNYQQFIQPRETAQGQAMNAKGPKRAPTNLRVRF